MLNEYEINELARYAKFTKSDKGMDMPTLEIFREKIIITVVKKILLKRGKNYETNTELEKDLETIVKKIIQKYTFKNHKNFANNG